MPIKTAIENTLQACFKQQKQLKIIDLFGTVEYDELDQLKKLN